MTEQQRSGSAQDEVTQHPQEARPMGHVKLVVLGPPGSGKGTHARTLAARLSVPHISTGELLRREIEARTPLGRQIADTVHEGGLVADEHIVELVQRVLGSDTDIEGWILDGAPRTGRQAELLAPLIEGEDPAIALALEVDDDEVRRRLERRRSDEQRQDDDPTVVDDRIALWAETGPQLTERYEQRGLLVSVDGSGTIADTSSRVWNAVAASISARESSRAEP